MGRTRVCTDFGSHSPYLVSTGKSRCVVPASTVGVLVPSVVGDEEGERIVRVWRAESKGGVTGVESTVKGVSDLWTNSEPDDRDRDRDLDSRKGVGEIGPRTRRVS